MQWRGAISRTFTGCARSSAHERTRPHKSLARSLGGHGARRGPGVADQLTPDRGAGRPPRVAVQKRRRLDGGRGASSARAVPLGEREARLTIGRVPMAPPPYRRAGMLHVPAGTPSLKLFGKALQVSRTRSSHTARGNRICELRVQRDTNRVKKLLVWLWFRSSLPAWPQVMGNF